jgi:hypothetical protein
MGAFILLFLPLWMTAWRLLGGIRLDRQEAFFFYCVFLAGTGVAILTALIPNQEIETDYGHVVLALGGYFIILAFIIGLGFYFRSEYKAKRT